MSTGKKMTSSMAIVALRALRGSVARVSARATEREQNLRGGFLDELHADLDALVEEEQEDEHDEQDRAEHDA